MQATLELYRQYSENPLLISSWSLNTGESEESDSRNSPISQSDSPVMLLSPLSVSIEHVREHSNSI